MTPVRVRLRREHTLSAITIGVLLLVIVSTAVAQQVAVATGGSGGGGDMRENVTFIAGLVTPVMFVIALVMNQGAKKKQAEYNESAQRQQAESIEKLEHRMSTVDTAVARMTDMLMRFEQSLREMMSGKLGTERAEGELKLVNQRIDSNEGRVKALETALVEKASGHRVANLEQRIMNIEEYLRIVPRHNRTEPEPGR